MGVQEDPVLLVPDPEGANKKPYVAIIKVFQFFLPFLSTLAWKLYRKLFLGYCFFISYAVVKPKPKF